MLFPLVNFDEISLAVANRALREWGHRMGELRRPNGSEWCHGLYHNGRLVGVATASTLIRPNAGGGVRGRTRENTVELSRLCASRRDLNRVLIRLWREFAFPAMGYRWAITYQDSVLHSGDLYRFDGWQRFPVKSRSGTDTRSGRTGRSKWVWGWPVDPELRAATETVVETEVLP